MRTLTLVVCLLLAGCGDEAQRVERQAKENKRLAAICEREGLKAHWTTNGVVWYVVGCKP